MERKDRLKGWILLGLAPLILYYIGTLYRLGGFSPLLALTLLMAIPGLGVLTLTGFRRAGSVPAWLSMTVGLITTLFACGEKGMALLIWSVCCGGPLAASLVWPSRPRIRPLAKTALPIAGGVWLGGALLYTHWHFGTWELSVVTRRIAERYLGLVQELEKIYVQIYPDGFPAELQDLLAIIKEQDRTVGFLMISLVSYLLFGSFFGCVWAADRLASSCTKERWLGGWNTLIPHQGLAWLYFAAYFICPFLKESVQLPASTVLNLSGFFFVFAALYTLREWMRKKKVRSVLQFLLIGAGFALAFFTVNGGALSVYSLLLIAGLVVTTTPAVVKKIIK